MIVSRWYTCSCGAKRSLHETRDDTLTTVENSSDSVVGGDVDHTHIWSDATAAKTPGTAYTLKLGDFYYQTTTQWGQLSCCQGYATQVEADDVAATIPDSIVVAL